MDILQKIIKHKHAEVNSRRSKRSIDELMSSDLFNREGNSMVEALTASDSSHIIAEFKRKSPSKGIINDAVSVGDVARGYEQAGCAGISILTDLEFFGGSPVDIENTRSDVSIPILRKDFIVDEYQIYEAKAMGADIILLIAEALEKDSIEKFAKKAKELGLEVLLEMHSENQLPKITEWVDIIGINNRDLKRFKVDIQTSIDLFSKIPAEFVKISESGIHNADAIIRLTGVGYQGFLIGENFMKHEDPGKAAADFVKNLQQLKHLW